MDYATALEVFYAPAPQGTPTPAPVRDASPARRLRDAVEPLAMHAVWAPLVNERLAARGLDFLTGYVWGRAAPMGEPAAALVASAFAAFEPGLIASLYEQARAVIGRADLLRVQEDAVSESLRQILGAAEIAPVVQALRRAVEVADGTGDRCSPGSGRWAGRQTSTASSGARARPSASTAATATSRRT